MVKPGYGLSHAPRADHALFAFPMNGILIGLVSTHGDDLKCTGLQVFSDFLTKNATEHCGALKSQPGSFVHYEVQHHQGATINRMMDWQLVIFLSG
jgi:hypothetical protein